MILMVSLTGGAAQIIGEGVDSSRRDEVLTDVSRGNMIAQSVDVVTAEEGAASFSVVDGNEVCRCPTGRKREPSRGGDSTSSSIFARVYL